MLWVLNEPTVLYKRVLSWKPRGPWQWSTMLRWGFSSRACRAMCFSLIIASSPTQYVEGVVSCHVDTMGHVTQFTFTQATGSSKSKTDVFLAFVASPPPFSSFRFVAPCKILMAFHDAQPGLRMWAKKKQVKCTKTIRRQ
jgi:hypothetical protein